jgi:soluble lytic murein transglycosylase-like protein
MHFLRIGLAVLGLWGPLTCWADGNIYGFVDSRGEVHLSNIPDDKRYESLVKTTVLASAEMRDGTAPVNADSRRPFGGVVAQVAGRYGIEAALLHAVISVESGYNPKAMSKRGAAGLMQLMPETAKRYGVVNVFDPAENVQAGAQYLSDLLKLFDNNLQLALAAYNAGEAAVIKYGKTIPPYRETAAYVPKVVGFYERLRLSM